MWPPPSGSGCSRSQEVHTVGFGDRIRQRRQQQGLSLQELAGRTSLTASFISQVEREVAEPSSLRKIAGALEVPVFYFLLDDAASNPVVRRGQRRVLRLHNTDAAWELLSPSDPSLQLEVVLTRLPPGEASGDEPVTHPGEECFVVLAGRMEITVAGQAYQLDEGDTIQIRATLPHQIRNPGPGELVVMAAITPPLF